MNIKRSCANALFAVALAAMPGAGAGQSWKPDKQVEIMAAAAPGGGYDTTARVLQRIIQDNKLLDVPVIVTNKPGGGGNIGYAYLTQKAGDPHILTIMTPTVMGNYITAKSQMNYTDFTPVALLYNESIGFATKSDSPIKSGKDFIDRIKKDPSSVSIGLGISLGNSMHVAVALVAKAAGVDVKKLKVVVFGTAEATTAGAGGHVDVIINRPSIMLGMLQSGQLRAFGVTAAQRESGPTSNIPTWREQGVDVVYRNWFAVLAPKNLTPEQAAYWDAFFDKLAKSEDWKKNVEKFQWTHDYKNSRDTRVFFDTEYKVLREVLGELGLARQ